jgi:hypothetical protein
VMNGGVSHLDLMVAVGLIGEAARAEDVDRLHVTLCRLRNDLAEHVTVEASAVEELPGAAGESVRRGQRHLLATVDDILTEADSDEGCACIVRASELRGLLVRQIRLEAALGTHHHRGGRGGSES